MLGLCHTYVYDQGAAQQICLVSVGLNICLRNNEEAKEQRDWNIVWQTPTACAMGFIYTNNFTAVVTVNILTWIYVEIIHKVQTLDGENTGWYYKSGVDSTSNKSLKQ